MSIGGFLPRLKPWASSLLLCEHQSNDDVTETATSELFEIDGPLVILTNDVPELLKQFRMMLSEHLNILGKLLVDPLFDFPLDVPAAVLVAFRSREHLPIILG